MSRSSNSDSCKRPALGGERLDGGRPERGDPVEPGGLQLLFDPGTGDHAAVADQHHPLQAEAFLQLVDLRGQRLRIARVAFEHLDRHRAAVGGAQQPEDDLRPVGPAVAAVAETGELATPALEIAGGDVVEHQRAVLQMPPRQRLLDRRLRRAQQIEGTVELVLVDLAQPAAPRPANAKPSPRSAGARWPASPPARPRGRRSAPGPAWRAAPAAAATAGRDRSRAPCRAPRRHDHAAAPARSRSGRRRPQASRRAAPAAAPRPSPPASPTDWRACGSSPCRPRASSRARVRRAATTGSARA